MKTADVERKMIHPVGTPRISISVLHRLKTTGTIWEVHPIELTHSRLNKQETSVDKS